MKAPSLLLATLTVAFGILAACSSDRPAGSSSGNTPIGPSSSSSSGGTSSGEGGASSGGPDASGLCSEGDNFQGGAVFEIEMGGTMPTAIGGKIVPGLYNLSELYIWKARVDAGDEPGVTSKPTGKQASMSIRMSETEAKLLTAEGTSSLGPTTFLGGGYKTDGVNLTLEGRCPSAASKSFTFTASSNGLVLYEGTREYVFALK